ncbi:hypothetical protein EMIHUDRAFT_106740 [Emiliania huxleyi CCMP1516]|uniref:Myosin motor domain-containing protein n=2 Tax=Emiliania huxleyi TaxID=2903 RepID=A0A0D3I6C6_EMIH1|nr:hypothetical protein EMIHUDRAFT_106740 [Emiliania huxleyi CCMP1516]EOD06811.1 hypothetical protein EMIHUDRAFT_106740 [Emiliania huxleyi CCMP1516]|eukprot:XP_005759240.1 hypothetical protein EMIHUDRAFT_106740 [Emiliania huxleyi CCMP1516]
MFWKSKDKDDGPSPKTLRQPLSPKPPNAADAPAVAEATEVWVPDKERVWVRGRVTRQVGRSELEVETEDGVTVAVDLARHDTLHTANPSAEQDMCSLWHMSEPAVLSNLQLRFAADQPYTYVAHLLIAVNPLKPIPDPAEARTATPRLLPPAATLTPRRRVSYEGAASSAALAALPPHQFAVAERAYRALLAQPAAGGGGRQDQSIVVSGESGAGKTESAKKLLRYITWRVASAAGGTKHDRRRSVGQTHAAAALNARILDSSPILESLGNAKTVRNHNSSRFGKFTKIDFDARAAPKRLRLVGASAVYSALFDWAVGFVNCKLGALAAAAERDCFIGILDIFGFESFAVNSVSSHPQLCVGILDIFGFESFAASSTSPASSILDIFGFESFDTNGFEQLLINFANEKLQATFNQHVFAAEQAEHAPRRRPDTAAETRPAEMAPRPLRTPPGVLHLLDETSRLPNQTDADFNKRVHDAHGAAAAARPPPARSPPTRGPSTSPPLAAPAAMSALVAELDSTRCNFVRCIKPNPAMAAGVFDAPYTVTQLRHTGMLQCCELLKHGFPTRISYTEVVERYAPHLPPDVGRLRLPPRDFAAAVAYGFGVQRDLYQLGATRLFFRAGGVACLDGRPSPPAAVFATRTAAGRIVARVRRWIVLRRFRRALAHTLAGLRLCRLLRRVRALALWRAALLPVRAYLRSGLRRLARRVASRRAAATIQAAARMAPHRRAFVAACAHLFASRAKAQREAALSAAAVAVQAAARRRGGRRELERRRRERLVVLTPRAISLQRWWRVVRGDKIARKLRSAEHRSLVAELLALRAACDESAARQAGPQAGPPGRASGAKRFEMWVSLQVGKKGRGGYLLDFFGDSANVGCKTDGGHYRIERSWKHFEAVLDYVRDGSCALPAAYSPKSQDNRRASSEEEELREFAGFYRIRPLLDLAISRLLRCRYSSPRMLSLLAERGLL